MCFSRSYTYTQAEDCYSPGNASLRRTGINLILLHHSLSIYDYDGNETCATDGLCALACPVKIDCGKLIKNIRAENVSVKAKNGDMDRQTYGFCDISSQKIITLLASFI